MEKLVQFLNELAKNSEMSATSMGAATAEMLLDNKGHIDMYFLRDSLEENISRSQLQKAFNQVFGKNIPTKFTFIKVETAMSKEVFLTEVYEPAKYRNVRSWVGHVINNYNCMINRKDVFDWIMSTAKSHSLGGEFYGNTGTAKNSSK